MLDQAHKCKGQIIKSCIKNLCAPIFWAHCQKVTDFSALDLSVHQTGWFSMWLSDVSSGRCVRWILMQYTTTAIITTMMMATIGPTALLNFWESADASSFWPSARQKQTKKQTVVYVHSFIATDNCASY